MDTAKHIAIYGTVTMIRERIGNDWRVRPIDKGEPIDGLVIKRMSGNEGKRKLPSAKQRAYLRDKFYDSCAYCERRFGSWINVDNRVTKITCHWDHFVPYVYAEDNSDINFLPTCQFCNQWKHSKMFRTIEAVKSYVDELWANKLSL